MGNIGRMGACSSNPNPNRTQLCDDRVHDQRTRQHQSTENDIMYLHNTANWVHTSEPTEQMKSHATHTESTPRNVYSALAEPTSCELSPESTLSPINITVRTLDGAAEAFEMTVNPRERVADSICRSGIIPEGEGELRVLHGGVDIQTQARWEDLCIEDGATVHGERVPPPLTAVAVNLNHILKLSNCIFVDGEVYPQLVGISHVRVWKQGGSGNNSIVVPLRIFDHERDLREMEEYSNCHASSRHGPPGLAAQWRRSQYQNSRLKHRKQFSMPARMIKHVGANHGDLLCIEEVNGCAPSARGVFRHAPLSD